MTHTLEPAIEQVHDDDHIHSAMHTQTPVDGGTARRLMGSSRAGRRRPAALAIIS